VVWKLVPESSSVDSFHSLQRVFSVDVSTARKFVGLTKNQYRDRIWESKEFASLHE